MTHRCKTYEHTQLRVSVLLLSKSLFSALTGLQIYHNYVRPHMALDGETPADKAGIHVRGENKWLTLIQNASRQTVAKSK